MTAELVPNSLLALLRAGRLDYWGAPYDSLDDAQREERRRATRHSVLWWFPQEWDRDEAAILASARGEGDPSLLPGLIDFAGDGWGGRFCVYPEWAVEGVSPVVYAVHDAIESKLYSMSFEQCLVRGLLEYFAFLAPEEEEVEPAVDAPAMAALIDPFVSPEDRVLLQRLVADPSPPSAERLLEHLVAALPPRRLEPWVIPQR